MEEIEGHEAVRSKVLSRTTVYWWDAHEPGDGERDADAWLMQTLSIPGAVATVAVAGVVAYAILSAAGLLVC